MPKYETCLGQIKVDGKWMDYARGTHETSRKWFEGDPENRRVVDWIYKERIIFPAEQRTITHTCILCGMNAHTDDLAVIGRNCPDSDFARPHLMMPIEEKS